MATCVSSPIIGLNVNSYTETLKTFQGTCTNSVFLCVFMWLRQFNSIFFFEIINIIITKERLSAIIHYISALHLDIFVAKFKIMKESYNSIKFPESQMLSNSQL